MTLPVMEPDLWQHGPDTLQEWARATDEGPFSSLCFGERVAFGNPETLTLLGAVSAWTARVRLVTTVVVPQLHDPVLLAKSLATADQLCRGRLVVGVGVGGRDEDYTAVGADLSSRTIAGMADRVETMRRIWSGEAVGDGTGPVGPPPVQDGGPPVLVGTLGPRTVRRAAAWADGLAGMSLDLDLAEVARLFTLARHAWGDSGRPAPRLTTSFWFALEETAGAGGARAQVHRHLRHYMSWLPRSLVDAMAPTTGFAGPAGALSELLEAMAAAGADEVHLVPTSADPGQLAEVAQLLS
jgi:alkanesulfonate monooxygenase SsuD/methylene tetrahydromethanopterin reductase-like flavin-dependent oxidoreductase (luciferase family)